MRTIEWTTQFKKDYRRESRSRYKGTLDVDLAELLELLQQDAPLPDRYVDHALRGRWRSFRDCHIYPDLILIYAKPTVDRLQLVRLGSHSELSL